MCEWPLQVALRDIPAEPEVDCLPWYAGPVPRVALQGSREGDPLRGTSAHPLGMHRERPEVSQDLQGP